MKRKIGELRNVPIVEGDKNLVRGGAEIHINDLQSKEASSGNSSKYAPKYYSIERDISDEIKGFISQYSSTIKQVYNGQAMINPSIFINQSDLTLIGFSFNPLHTEILNAVVYVDSIEDFTALFGNEDADLLLQCIKRITEEEYYKIDYKI